MYTHDTINICKHIIIIFIPLFPCVAHGDVMDGELPTCTKKFNGCAGYRLSSVNTQLLRRMQGSSSPSSSSSFADDVIYDMGTCHERMEVGESCSVSCTNGTEGTPSKFHCRAPGDDQIVSPKVTLNKYIK